jgi:hypothetical protein
MAEMPNNLEQHLIAHAREVGGRFVLVVFHFALEVKWLVVLLCTRAVAKRSVSMKST